MHLITFASLMMLTITGTYHQPARLTKNITVSSLAYIHEASDKFLSIALDCSLAAAKWKTFQPLAPSVIAMATALSPAYLRLGGTTCDYLIFNTSESSTVSTSNTTNVTLHFPLQTSAWDNLVNLSRQAGLTLLFDSNLMQRDKNNQWDPTNFRQFVVYNQARNISNLIFELGNEPNNYLAHFNKTLLPQQIAKDFATMREILDEFPLYRNSLLVGADIGNPYVTAYASDPANFIRDFLQYGHEFIDALTWHQYYFQGSGATVNDFINVTIMNVFQKQVDVVRKIIQDVIGAPFPVWMGETSTAWDSGAPNISNTYVAGFLWMDKLGIAAQASYDVVIRQTFYDGWYALMDSNLQPNPDFWLSVLYKRLVGSRSLNVTESGSPVPQVRAYCHCTAESGLYRVGDVTVYALNVDQHASVVIETQYKGYEIDAYVLTPHNGELTSTTAYLNGEALFLRGDQLPALLPTPVTTVQLDPLTYGFFVIKNASASACMMTSAAPSLTSNGVYYFLLLCSMSFLY